MHTLIPRSVALAAAVAVRQPPAGRPAASGTTFSPERTTR
jgi:hypothetical protein